MHSGSINRGSGLRDIIDSGIRDIIDWLNCIKHSDIISDNLFDSPIAEFVCVRDLLALG